VTARFAALGALLLLALTHCASTSSATATIELLSIAPAAGSALDANTVLVAEIRYSIEHFQPRADYYLAPLFGENGGAGKTFNTLDRFDQATHVKTPSGVATVRYGVARELASAKLARPVQVFFFLMERTGAHTTRVIGSAGPVEYR
jgi:hypothetical protein